MLVKRIGEYFIHFHFDPAGRKKCPLNHLNCEEKASVGDCHKYFKGMVVLLVNIYFMLLIELPSHSHLEVALWESPVKIRINTLFAPRTI